MIKKILLLLALLTAVALTTGYIFYRQIFGPNLNPGKMPYELLVPKGSSFHDLYEILEKDNVLLHPMSFQRIAGWMHYKRDIIPSGRYLLKGNMSNYDIISKLRIANQDPVRLSFHSARTYVELCGILAKPLALDSLQIYEAMDSIIRDSSNGISRDNLLSYFIPNTYLIYWDITRGDLLQRLLKEHDKYWAKPERKEALQRLGLNPEEVYTLASIVEKESNLEAERPTIAGVYLNRLKRGIKLQADPTVVFATGDFRLRRVLHKHLKIQSPYNTYLHTGLPPGPICMPSLNALDAVLEAEKHNFIFFCAKPGYKGAHNFATDLRGHNRNARLYRDWLNKEHIK